MKKILINLKLKTKKNEYKNRNWEIYVKNVKKEGKIKF